MMATRAMTNYERIEALEHAADAALTDVGEGEQAHVAFAMVAVACELRALRLVLQTEIREAAYRLGVEITRR